MFAEILCLALGLKCPEPDLPPTIKPMQMSVPALTVPTMVKPKIEIAIVPASRIP